MARWKKSKWVNGSSPRAEWVKKKEVKEDAPRDGVEIENPFLVTQGARGTDQGRRRDRKDEDTFTVE